MAITIYNSSTGQIMRSVSCPDNEKSLQCSANESFLDGVYSAALSYIKDGEVVQKPEKPSDYHKFDYETKQWVEWRTIDMVWDELRRERNALLASCDWTQVPDAPVDQVAWAAYRQALRDMPSNTTDPRNPVWPSKPA